MELRIEKMQLPAPITFNFEELKTELAERVQHYEGLVYGADQIREAKADRAVLNKLKKTINDERIRLEREYNTPFQVFKGQVNEILDLIDAPIAAIDRQIKAYDEQRKEKKQQEIMILLSNVDLPYDIDPKKLYNDKWLNAAYTGDKIGAEIDSMLEQIQDDVEILENLTEYQEEAIMSYKHTLDIRAALRSVDEAKAKDAEKSRIHNHIQEQMQKLSGQTEAIQPGREEPEPVIEPPKTAVPAAWIRFEAYLSAEQAAKLKAFFKENQIEYRRA